MFSTLLTRATTSSLAPISLASTVIGFISFFFTLLIWIHAFWDGFHTILSAPSQLKDALSTLRQALYEEREYLKRKRRRQLPSSPSRSKSGKAYSNLYIEGGPDRVINDAVKDLIRDFKGYERPFLRLPEGARGRGRHGEEKELEWSFDASQQYYQCDFMHRLMWLRVKGGVNSVAEKLQRIQTRRIAVEVTETRFMIGDLMGLVRETEGRVGRIEERLLMSRVGEEAR